MKYMLKQYLKIAFFFSFICIADAHSAINVGIIAPLAGEYQTVGQELVSGVRTAVDEINAQGGLKGRKINLVMIDDQCDDRIAVSTAQMMAVNVSERDKMSLVIGPYCSNALQKIAAVYARAGILQIIPTTVSSSIKSQNYKGLVKMVGYKTRQAGDFFNFYQEHFPDRKVALIYDRNNKDVVDVAAELQKLFTDSGKTAAFQSYNFQNYYDDYDRIAEDVIKDGNKIAYILGKSKRVARMAKSLKSEREDFVLFVNKYQAQKDYRETMGKKAEGTFVVALPTLKDSPDFAETLVKLRLLGVEPEGLSVYGYSAVQLWKELVNKADSFKYDRLAETLSENKFDTGWGEMMFTNGDPSNSVGYGIYQIKNGEYTQVY